jgi:hypothetical protein
VSQANQVAPFKHVFTGVVAVQAHVVSPPTTPVISVGVRTLNESLERFNFRYFIIEYICNTDARCSREQFQGIRKYVGSCLHGKRTAAHGSRVATHQRRGACIKQDSDQLEQFCLQIPARETGLQKITGVE